MLYKLAASKRKLQDDAARRVDSETLAKLVGHYTDTGNVPTMVVGYNEGDKAGHPVVGTVFGPAAINGSIAKDTGVSTFGTTVKRSARNYGILGAGTGALTGIAAGLQGGFRPAGILGSGLVGGLAGGIIGAGGGAAGNAIAYGTGYTMGANKSHKRKRK